MSDECKTPPGGFCWNELMTRDTSKAEAFYKELFGWTTMNHNMGEMTYTIFMQGDKGIGGMLQTPQDKAHIPPHWMSYVAVQDVEISLEKAKSLGATIIAPKSAAGEMGYFGVIQDPTGAHIALWQSLQ